MLERLVSLPWRGAWWWLVAGAFATGAAAIDLDRDQMSDVWERLYEEFPDQLSDPSGDPDYDGVSNRDESVAGTNPNDGGDYLYLNLSKNAGTGGTSIRWREQSGKRYHLETAEIPAASAWSTVTRSNPSDPFPPHEDIAAGSDLIDHWHLWEMDDDGYDRVWALRYDFVGSIQPEHHFAADLDQDGQANYVESYAGTNPAVRESRFEAALAADRSNLRLNYYGDSGVRHYQIDVQLPLTAYSSGSLQGTQFEPFAHVLDDSFQGAIAGLGDPVRISSLATPIRLVRTSAGFLSIPGPEPVVWRSDAQFHDAGQGRLLIVFPASTDRSQVAVITPVLIGEWYFGQSFQLAVEHGGGAAGRRFYRLRVSDREASGGLASWEKAVLAGRAGSEDWDGDDLDNATELMAGSNVFDRDSDGDGLLDHYELRSGTLAQSSGVAPYGGGTNSGLVVYTPGASLVPPGDQ